MCSSVELAFRGVGSPGAWSSGCATLFPRNLPLQDISRLLESPWHEERLLALLILVGQYQRGDVRRRAAI
jgi:hypothetical protein